MLSKIVYMNGEIREIPMGELNKMEKNCETMKTKRTKFQNRKDKGIKVLECDTSKICSKMRNGLKRTETPHISKEDYLDIRTPKKKEIASDSDLEVIINKIPDEQDDFSWEIGNTGYHFVRNPLILKNNLFPEYPQEKWVVQKFLQGGYVPKELLDSTPPIITKGMTSISVTDNRYTSEVKGMPSWRTAERQEFVVGNKESNKMIRTHYREFNLIKSYFASYVHNIFLCLIGKRYSSEMKKYQKVINITPIISKEQILYELNTVIDNYKIGHKSNLPDRKKIKGIGYLYHKNGMPKYSITSIRRTISELNKLQGEHIAELMVLRTKYPIVCKDKTQIPTGEFIKSRELYRHYVERLPKFYIANNGE